MPKEIFSFDLKCNFCEAVITSPSLLTDRETKFSNVTKCKCGKVIKPSEKLSMAFKVIDALEPDKQKAREWKLLIKEKMIKKVDSLSWSVNRRGVDLKDVELLKQVFVDDEEKEQDKIIRKKKAEAGAALGSLVGLGTALWLAKEKEGGWKQLSDKIETATEKDRINKAALVLESYKIRLEKIGYDTKQLEELILKSATDKEIEETCKNILKNNGENKTTEEIFYDRYEKVIKDISGYSKIYTYMSDLKIQLKTELGDERGEEVFDMIERRLIENKKL